MEKYSCKERLIILELFPYPKRLVIKKVLFCSGSREFLSNKESYKRSAYVVPVSGYEFQLCNWTWVWVPALPPTRSMKLEKLFDLQEPQFPKMEIKTEFTLIKLLWGSGGYHIANNQ